jgi:hypothetical protein
MNNLISLLFLDKKALPPGEWSKEPDFCSWYRKTLPCIVVRDMTLGIWKAFVGVPEDHPFYAKTIEDLSKLPQGVDLFLGTYGGLSGAGVIPQDKFEGKFWWLGIETSHGGDLVPGLNIEGADPGMVKVMQANQTYKGFKFIRKETNSLADRLFKIAMSPEKSDPIPPDGPKKGKGNKEKKV